MISVYFHHPRHFLPMKRPTENRLPATAAPVPRLLRRIALLGCIALAFGLGSCDSKKDNAKPPSDETPPVAETPLAKAAIQGDLTEISQQLKGGADINARDPLGRTPLHMAAFYGRVKTAEYLISHGADINASDRVGMTPLHVAVLSGGRQVTQVLLDHKADLAKRSDAGQTALHLSAATGQHKLTKFLLERGADPTVKDAEGRTPLSYAVQNKHPQTASVLRQSLPKP